MSPIGMHQEERLLDFLKDARNSHHSDMTCETGSAAI